MTKFITAKLPNNKLLPCPLCDSDWVFCRTLKYKISDFKNGDEIPCALIQCDSCGIELEGFHIDIPNAHDILIDMWNTRKVTNAHRK